MKYANLDIIISIFYVHNELCKQSKFEFVKSEYFIIVPNMLVLERLVLLRLVWNIVASDRFRLDKSIPDRFE